MNGLLQVTAVGIGATVVMDIWGIARRPLLGWPPPDYSMTGRWIGHMTRGSFRHAAIARAAPVRSEGLLGWLLHYLTGIALAGLLVAICGRAWLAQPTPGPALLFGVATVAVPYLLVQPAMGTGLAASRSARPGQARLQSLLTHAVFGAGLYLAAATLAMVRDGSP